MISCIFHELGHFLAIKSKKLKIDNLSVNLVGGCIKSRELYGKSHAYLLFVYSAGIIFNIFLGFMCCFIANRGFYSRNFFVLSGINFLLAFFNALPIKTLDGHFIAKHFLLIFTQNKQNVCVFLNFTSFFTNILLLIIGVFYASQANFSIFLISVYLFISSHKNYSLF